MDKVESHSSSKQVIKKTRKLNFWFAYLILALVLIYTFGVVLGYIPPDQRIDSTNLILIIAALIFVAFVSSPDFGSRITRIGIQNFLVEFDRIKERQIEIENFYIEVLNEIQRSILVALYTRTPAKFTVNDELREAVRSMRSMGLIAMKSGKTVHSMPADLDIDPVDWMVLRKSQFINRMAQKIVDVKRQQSSNLPPTGA